MSHLLLNDCKKILYILRFQIAFITHSAFCSMHFLKRLISRNTLTHNVDSSATPVSGSFKKAVHSSFTAKFTYGWMATGLFGYELRMSGRNHSIKRMNEKHFFSFSLQFLQANIASIFDSGCRIKMFGRKSMGFLCSK